MAAQKAQETWACRACGFDRGGDVWGGDENLNFTYDICDCCGAEAGTDDFNVEAVRRYRSKWTAEGCNWFIPTVKPEGWSFGVQKNFIPSKWL